ncbi:MAG: hypothetical protein WBB25_18860 [Sulfitobacter sp.]
MRYILFASVFLIFFQGPLIAEQDRFVALAKQGWNYELRTTMLGRDMAIPVEIHGRTLTGATLCLVGEAPHQNSLTVIVAFSGLMKHVFAEPISLGEADKDARACPEDTSIILRLYSGYPANAGLTADLAWLNEKYRLGLPRNRRYMATSPAMGQTFFGRLGQATHLMVKQPSHQSTSALEEAFYRSILIEELYQSFSFGMDLLLFDRETGFTSKLQETPVNLQRLPWGSKELMRALVNSNPGGLCLFDVFMLHAIARAPVTQTVEPAFITFIDANYEQLLAQARLTMDDPAYALLLAPDCARSAF